jgi:hypothetical protein
MQRTEYTRRSEGLCVGGAFLESLTPTAPEDVYVTEVAGALGAEPLCFPRTGFLSTLHELNRARA